MSNPAIPSPPLSLADFQASDCFFEEMELLPCACYLVKDDSDLTFLHGNSSFYRLFSCSEEEMRTKYGRRFGAMIDPQSLSALGNLLTKRQPGALEPVEFVQRIKRNGRDAWIRFHIRRRIFRGESALFCLSFDVTVQEAEKRGRRRGEEIMYSAALQAGFDSFTYAIQTKIAHVCVSSSILPLLLPPGQTEVYNLPELLILAAKDTAGCEKTVYGTFNALNRGEKAACELPITLNGQRIWMRLTLAVSSPGQAIGTLQNITQQKETTLRYLNETQFYQAMLSEKDAFAQVDITDNRCTRFGGMWNLYNELMDKITYSQLIDEFINKVVHPEDRKHYLEIMQRDNFIESLQNGIDRLGCEFRRIVEQNKMVWMELSVHLFREPLTGHVLGLLYIKNIDAKKKQELALLHDSERDHLTNIFNKKMAENSIRDYLKRMPDDEICAFMVLDLDNFKYINDNYGHQSGDRVLVRLAELLGGAFRRYDIIGRFGGDEFILFLKNIGSMEMVQKRIDAFYGRLQQEKNPEISCSIGVALLNAGESYGHIFQRADAALYAAKSGGKGRVIFYTEDSPQEDPPAPSAEEERSRVRLPQASKKVSAAEEELVSFDSFIAEQGDLAYLVDPDTFTLIRGNRAFYDRIGMTETECAGMKCYEAMHRRETPCPFCSKANWSTDKFYLWRNVNTALEQEFLIKNKLVSWRGKEALLALSIDISNDKSIVDSMENGATESHSILSGVQRMTEADSLDSAMSSALEIIGYFFRADAVHLWERGGPDSPYRSTRSWIKKGGRKSGPEADRPQVSAWLEGRTWANPVMLESPEAMLCESYDMYEFMKENNIHNERWARLRDEEQTLGFLSVDNISSNFQNIAFLESFTVFMSNEIKKRRLVEGILYLNQHDDLTDLLSRSRYEEYLADFNGDASLSIGVMMANFNNLKGINRSKGFQAGNDYIRQFGDMLRQIFSAYPVFRLNGDEFLAICPDIERTDLENRVRRLEEKVAENESFSVSVGYSWDDVENDLTVLIEQATQAMKVDKKRHYDSIPLSDDLDRRRMLSQLVAALENREFEVFLQPKVELIHGTVMGAEALIRYRHKKLGLIPPAKFIDILERNNLIRYIDLFVFEEICSLLQEWKRRGFMLPTISLNFSRLTLLERDILASMESIISRYDVSRKHIEIEITESVASMGKSILFQAARDLYNAGFAISLDDFGTKYTNLSILADIDFHMLKLDKSLIGDLDAQQRNQVILKNIIYMCKDLGIDVIAEGIETKKQEDVLRNLRCKLGQGYLYGKPMPIAQFNEKYFSSERRIS